MKKKSHQRFLDEVYAVNHNIVILSEYIGANDKISSQCKLCGNIWSPTASSLLRGGQCPQCHGKTLPIEKSLFFTHPQIARMMKNESDQKKYSHASTKRVDWICPICGETVEQKTISDIVSLGRVPCKMCSDGVSYPNKYMFSLLKQLGVEFVAEYSPRWISPKRYDFYVPSYQIIIEMDGAIGHGNKTIDGSNGDYLYQIDRYKDKSAEEHGLKVVRIDCLISDSDYISGKIINSELSNIFDFALVDWGKCNFDAYSSLKKKVVDIWNDCGEMSVIMDKTGLSRYTIIKYLTDGTKYGWCKYDGKEQQRKSGQRNIGSAYQEIKRPVICLNNNMVFESLREANTWAGLALDAGGISKVCRGVERYETAGRHPVTHERLRWAYFDKNNMTGVA